MKWFTSFFFRINQGDQLDADSGKVIFNSLFTFTPSRVNHGSYVKCVALQTGILENQDITDIYPPQVCKFPLIDIQCVFSFFLIQIISQPFDVVFAPLAAEELKIIEVDLGAPESYVTLEFYANPTPSSDQVNSYNRIKTFSTHNTFASTGDLAHCKGQCGRFPSISCRDDPGSLQRQNARLLASQRSDNQSGEFRPRPSNPRH